MLEKQEAIEIIEAYYRTMFKNQPNLEGNEKAYRKTLESKSYGTVLKAYKAILDIT
ncbi:MAG: hypothetical protein GY754_14645 [bacterium]|nr:hypothetical protein [bacterium]